MALLDTLLAPVFAALGRFFSPLGKLWDKIVSAVGHLTSVGSRTTDLFTSIRGEIDGWRNFRENPNFKNRLISLPSAYDKTKQLLLGIPASWNALVDLFKSLRDKVQGGGDPKAEAEDFAAELESGEGVSGLIKKLPRLAKGLEKLFGWLAIITDALETISRSIDDLQTIVDELRGIREEIEGLDSIFLSQKNPRKTLKLEDGTNIRIRVGSLHKSQ